MVRSRGLDFTIIRGSYGPLVRLGGSIYEVIVTKSGMRDKYMQIAGGMNSVLTPSCPRTDVSLGVEPSSDLDCVCLVVWVWLLWEAGLPQE